MTNLDPALRARRTRIARNVVSGVLAYAGWTIAMGSFLIYQHWAWTAPSAPDVTHTIAEKGRGGMVYFTAQQQVVHLATLVAGMAAFFVAFRIVPKRDVVERRSFLSRSMTFKFDDPERVRYWAWGAGVAVGLAIVLLIDPSVLPWTLANLPHF